MYKVTIENDGVKTVIHSPYVNDVKLTQGIIKKEINKIDSFNISFTLNNPAYGKIRPFKTLINVFNMKTHKYEFEGRVLGPTKDMDSSGVVVESYECEGELGYLHDCNKNIENLEESRKICFVIFLNTITCKLKSIKDLSQGFLP